MQRKIAKGYLLTASLAAVYLVILTWIILFKMQFSFNSLDHLRSINLIPFHKSVIVNNKIRFSEIYDNIIIFIPFGLYISMLKNSWPFIKKAAPIAAVSLCFETLQFTFAIGASDITDVIGNTLGGIIGIATYTAVKKLLKTDFKAVKALNIIALLGTICITILLAILVF